MEFQLSYSKSWKMMLWKCCTHYSSKFGKLSSGHRTGKGQFSFQSQRKAMPKNAQTTSQLHSSHRLVKYCSKFSKPGFQQNVNRELPDVQAGFRKGRGTRDQIANICWITKKGREFQKSIYFCSERSRLVSGPGMKSSPPEAKNPSVFHGSATTFHCEGLKANGEGGSRGWDA